MKFTRVSALIAASTLLLAAAAMGGASASAVASPAAEEPGSDASEPYPLSPEVFNGAVRLRDEGPKLYPDTFGGIASGVDGNQDVLVVYLTKQDSAVENDIISRLDIPRDKIEFEQAGLTAHGAERLNARVTADIESGALPGVVRWGITRDVKVLIGFSSDSARGSVPDLSEYGPGIEVQTDIVADDVAADRFSDTAPWNAGNFLTQHYSGCTSAFPVKWNATGNKYILTAGHCFSVGQDVFNYAWNPIGSGGNALVGSVTNQSFGNNQLDAELIAADGSRNIWTGGITPSGTVAVQAFLDPWDGVPLCISGAYDGQSCGLTASNVHMSTLINYGGGAWTVPNTSTITMTSKQFLGQGDSGAPIYATLSGVTYGFGIFISVANSGSVACGNWNVQFGSSRICNNRGQMTDIGPILTKWDLSLD